MPPAPDDSLISRVKAGDSAAFEGLVTRYKGLVFSTIFRIVSDRDAASDVMQEAFFKAYSGLGQLQDPRAFRSWLMRIAANESLRYVRQRRPELMEEDAAQEASAFSAVAPSPEQAVENQWTLRAVEDAIEQLPVTYRAALLLRFFNQLPYSEIAAALDITLANVKFRIHHGVRLLRARLDPGRD